MKCEKFFSSKEQSDGYCKEYDGQEYLACVSGSKNGRVYSSSTVVEKKRYKPAYDNYHNRSWQQPLVLIEELRVLGDGYWDHYEA